MKKFLCLILLTLPLLAFGQAVSRTELRNTNNLIQAQKLGKTNDTADRVSIVSSVQATPPLVVTASSNQTALRIAQTTGTGLATASNLVEVLATNGEVMLRISSPVTEPFAIEIVNPTGQPIYFTDAPGTDIFVIDGTNGQVRMFRVQPIVGQFGINFDVSQAGALVVSNSTTAASRVPELRLASKNTIGYAGAVTFNSSNVLAYSIVGRSNAFQIGKGGTMTAPAHYILRETNEWLFLRTNVIVEAGSVGIGTNAPAQALEVQGNVNVSGSITNFGAIVVKSGGFTLYDSVNRNFYIDGVGDNGRVGVDSGGFYSISTGSDIDFANKIYLSSAGVFGFGAGGAQTPSASLIASNVTLQGSFLATNLANGAAFSWNANGTFAFWDTAGSKRLEFLLPGGELIGDEFTGTSGAFSTIEGGLGGEFAVDTSGNVDVPNLTVSGASLLGSAVFTNGTRFKIGTLTPAGGNMTVQANGPREIDFDASGNVTIVAVMNWLAGHRDPITIIATNRTGTPTTLTLGAVTNNFMPMGNITSPFSITNALYLSLKTWGSSNVIYSAAYLANPPN